MNIHFQKEDIALFFKKIFGDTRQTTNNTKPFWAIVNKEIADHIKSWRFLILVSIIGLTCIGSMYTALSSIEEALKSGHAEDVFLFLKIYTVSDGTLPPYFIFIGFLGPLLGIGLGFDVINSEQNRGTLSRILSQPIPRDYFINAKFLASLLVIGVLFFALSFLVMGVGIISIGIPPTPEEFLRIMLFTLASIIYVAFWLNLSILFSIKFQQSATSALTGIASWLFFTIFYSMIVNVIFNIFIPSGRTLSIAAEQFKLGILRFAPNQLFSEITTSLLSPSVRSLGPLTMQQMQGAIPGHLPAGQSFMLIWPQLIGLMALTTLCFVISYISFMKKEIH
jgi:ABC-2 type transport system permease protein